MLNEHLPVETSLLISEPFMMDPHFQRAVIFLCEHDPQEGTVGFILNQPSTLLIGDLVGELAGSDLPVYIGGPVEQESLHFIHKQPELIPDGLALENGLFWGGNFENVIGLMRSEQLQPGDIKFFLGYSGWDLGQLDLELKDNSWVVLNDYHPDIIFEGDPDDLWREAIIAMGPKFAHVANFPVNPQWN